MYLKEFAMVVLIMLSIDNIKAQPFFNVGTGVRERPMLSLYADTINNLLYAGGEFNVAGYVTAHAIAKWDGISWDSLRNQIIQPPLDQIRCISMLNGSLFLGGPFGYYDTLGIIAGGGIALWDAVNKAITNFGANPDNADVAHLYSNNGNLFITGNFDSIGGLYSPKIARYDGTNWYAYPPLDTVGGGYGIFAAHVYNGELYVGGNFDSQLSTNMKDIAKWDGSQWLPVSNGLSGFGTFLQCFAVFQNKLIIGGYFLTMFGDPGNCILAWDGVQWSPFGTGLQNSGVVRCMQVYNNELWVGGGFFDAGGVPVTYIAKWDGTQWHNVGAILDNVVTSMAVLNNDLYVGGAFQTLNGDTVNHIFRYNYLTGFDNMLPSKKELSVYPNPANDFISIKILSVKTNPKITIMNVLGKTVKTVNQFDDNIFIGDLANGFYILKLEENKIHKQLKFSIMR